MKCTECDQPASINFAGRCEGCFNSRESATPAAASPHTRRGRTPRDPHGRAKRVHVGLTHDANEELTKRAAQAGKSLSLTAALILEEALAHA